MGIFSTSNHVRRGSQKITERFLKQMGFHKDYWGSPHENYKKPGSEFWEKYIFDEESLAEVSEDDAMIVATIWYFPENFTGYVTSYNMSGCNPATGTFCQFHGDDSGWSYRGYSKCKMDIIYALDMTLEEVKQRNLK